MYLLELPQWGSFNEYIQHTIILIEDRKDILKLS